MREPWALGLAAGGILKLVLPPVGAGTIVAPRGALLGKRGATQEFAGRT